MEIKITAPDDDDDGINNPYENIESKKPEETK
jgi:hypothetical protein